MSRKVKNSGISRWMCAFRPISCSKDTFETGRKLCAALSCSLRKYFSTAWRMVSDSATASDSVSIRNHVLPPGASQTYLMIPPNMASGNQPASRGWACDVGKKQNPESGASQQQHRQISCYLEAVPICSRSVIGSAVLHV